LFVEAATLHDYQKIQGYLEKFGYMALSKWAATPVYHFSVNPTEELKAAARKARYFSVARIGKRSIFRWLHGLVKKAPSS
jgi:hypothetical protein